MSTAFLCELTSLSTPQHIFPEILVIFDMLWSPVARKASIHAIADPTGPSKSQELSKSPVKPADHIGGNPSLDGWHYQCDVSVFAALDLLVVNRVAKVLQLEPATQEDLEAELQAPRVSSSTVVDGERLVVQAKLRRTGQWTPASLRDLVEHGEKRPSALKLLEDTKVRYVLFTSADVSGTLGALQVDALLERPGDDDLPADVFPATHVEAAAGRFAVLAQYNEARVVEKIDAYLLSPLGIPRERHEACREELRKVAMAGMRTGYAWPRGDVEAIIKRHGGSIPSERDRKFVRPQTGATSLPRWTSATPSSSQGRRARARRPWPRPSTSTTVASCLGSATWSLEVLAN
jgi:hypothetical protein